MDREDILEENTKNINSLLWGQCTEALHQGLRGNEYFEDKYIKFYAKWTLNQIKLTTQGIKEERNLNPYESVYKLIRQFLNFCQAEDESCDKFLKCFQDLSSSLKLSGIETKNHSHLQDIEYKKLVKSYPKMSTTLAKKEAALSSSEALT